MNLNHIPISRLPPAFPSGVDPEGILPRHPNKPPALKAPESWGQPPAEAMCNSPFCICLFDLHGSAAERCLVPLTCQEPEAQGGHAPCPRPLRLLTRPQALDTVSLSPPATLTYVPGWVTWCKLERQGASGFSPRLLKEWTAIPFSEAPFPHLSNGQLLGLDVTMYRKDLAQCLAQSSC